MPFTFDPAGNDGSTQLTALSQAQINNLGIVKLKCGGLPPVPAPWAYIVTATANRFLLRPRVWWIPNRN